MTDDPAPTIDPLAADDVRQRLLALQHRAEAGLTDGDLDAIEQAVDLIEAAAGIETGERILTSPVTGETYRATRWLDHGDGRVTALAKEPVADDDAVPVPDGGRHAPQSYVDRDCETAREYVLANVAANERHGDPVTAGDVLDNTVVDGGFTASVAALQLAVVLLQGELYRPELTAEVRRTSEDDPTADGGLDLHQEHVDEASIELERLLEADDHEGRTQSALGRLLAALPDSEYGAGASPFDAETDGGDA